MSYKEQVKKSNKVAFKIIDNAIKNNKLSHAYLFSGPDKVDLKTPALFLGESLINIKSESHRSINGYSGLITIDGSLGTIRKESVVNAVKTMSETTLDQVGKKIMIIYNIENANAQSVNSLLKFIEEPTENTYIIMTTNNLLGVLSTIQSRSQIITITPHSKNDIASKLMNNGIKEQKAKVIANISSSIDDALEISKSDSFTSAYHLVQDVFEKTIVAPSALISSFKKVINKNNYKMYVDLMNIFISDIYRLIGGESIIFANKKVLISRYRAFNYQKALVAINDFLVSVNSYVNFDLAKIAFLINLKSCF